jgi:hypothetical protein
VKLLAVVMDFLSFALSKSYLKTAFHWSQTAIDVALFLLSECDSILTADTVNFVTHFQKLLSQVTASRAPKVLRMLPNILGMNQNVLLSDSVALEPIISAIAGSADPWGRLAFLESYVLLFARTPGIGAQDALIAGFLCLFDDPSPSVTSRLTASDTYAFFSPAKLLQIVPSFTRLIPSLAKWPDISRAAGTFLSFPSDIVREFWGPVTDCLLPHFVHHCHPLSNCCAAFFARLCPVLDRDSRGELTARIVAGFADDHRWAVRRLFVNIVTRFARLCEGVPDFGAFLAHYGRMLADPVPAVVVAALLAWASVRSASGAMEHDLAAQIAELADAPDPRVREVCETVVERAGPRKVSSLGSIPQDSGLHRFLAAASLRIGNQKVARRIITPGRVVMTPCKTYRRAGIHSLKA